MAFALLLLTWLIASIPFGLVVAQRFGDGRDLRQEGSGNIGATNVARSFGWKLALPVLLLDMAKGFVPVWLAGWFWPEAGIWWPGVVALLAFLSHCYPVYLKLRGGKGVATSAGALLALSPQATGLAIAVWLAVLAGTGRSSVAALSATASMLVFVAFLHPAALPVVALLALGIAWTHRPNLQRLLRGEESQVVQPVRFRRAPPADPTILLERAPSGTDAPSPLWKECPLSPDAGEAAEAPLPPGR